MSDQTSTATYTILGKPSGGKWEEIDEIEGRAEASRIVEEYILAFVSGWTIKKVRIDR